MAVFDQLQGQSSLLALAPRRIISSTTTRRLSCFARTVGRRPAALSLAARLSTST